MGAKVLVHGRDSKLRGMEATAPYSIPQLKGHSNLEKPEYQGYQGVVSKKHPIKSIYSPDGRFVVSGSEDGEIHIWNARTFSLERDLMNLFPSIGCPVYDVAWHPTQHLLAFAGYGKGQRIFVFQHEQDPEDARELAEEEVLATEGRPTGVSSDGVALRDETAERLYEEYMNKIYQSSEEMFNFSRRDRIRGPSGHL